MDVVKENKSDLEVLAAQILGQSLIGQASGFAKTVQSHVSEDHVSVSVAIFRVEAQGLARGGARFVVPASLTVKQREIVERNGVARIRPFPVGIDQRRIFEVLSNLIVVVRLDI